MTIILILLVAIAGTGAALYAEHRFHLRRKGPKPAEPEEEPQQEECCGMHITCERDSLLASVSETIEYYDDEELDAFKGRNPESYTDDEIEQFRDVLLTLLPQDIAGWGRSIQLRGIELPPAVREELLMIVAEARHDAVNPN